ncbi:MAG: hypothetical protein JRN58_05360 [Nitrososphaerota archaeon]|nr:hypothetical protein [Nitrososphaerota archaeon]
MQVLPLHDPSMRDPVLVPLHTVEPSDVVIEITLWACAAGGAATTAKTMKEEARRRKRTRGEDGFLAWNSPIRLSNSANSMIRTAEEGAL